MHLSLGSNTLIQAKNLPALLSPTCLYALVGMVAFCAKAVKRFSFACHLKAIREGSWVRWKRKKEQIIFEAGTLAAVVAFILWKKKFSNKRCVMFVDNEGTKFSLLKGSPKNLTIDADALAGFFTEKETLVHAFTWLARVPSKSNIGDPPSRNEISLPFFKQTANVSKDVANVMLELVTRLDEIGEKGCVTNHSGKNRSNADMKQCRFDTGGFAE